MARADLGRTLIIANPAAHSGKGAKAAESAERFFAHNQSATRGYELWRTAAPGDARRMAKDAAGFDTVVALGGDGVIHEVGNGLMGLPERDRPRLGVIPFGSGNDFARTLGLSLNDTSAAINELLTADERTFDVGYVSSDACPEGCYFLETLSFGLDAAIALDTTLRRSRGTAQQGSGLFVTSSLKVMAQAREAWPATLRMDGGEQQQLRSLILAVQNGPTYGGGFRICPQAEPDDGLLDLCYNVRNPRLLRLLVLLGLAYFGRHGRSSAVRMAKARELEVSFGGAHAPCPCQVDGEELEGSSFAVRVVPAALRVMAKSGT